MTKRKSTSGPRDRRAPTRKPKDETEYQQRHLKPPMKGRTRKLTPEQYRRWKKVAGRNRKV